MKKLSAAISVIFLLMALTAQSLNAGELGHKLVDFTQHAIDFQEFSYPSAVDGKPIELRALAQGKKVMLVTFFAGWCENSRHDAKTIAKLLEKYGSKGLGVVGVCEYSSTEEIADFLKAKKPAYPIGIETTSEKDRLSSSHYKYRTACNDDRKWGTPFTVLIDAKNVIAQGPVFATTLYAANGEMDRKHAEKLLNELLGK